MSNEDADIYIYAHTHKPYIRYIKGKCVINIGSVGLPLDGFGHSSYALIDIQGEDFQTSIVRSSYDVGQVISQFRDSDYPNKEMMIKVLERSV